MRNRIILALAPALLVGVAAVPAAARPAPHAAAWQISPGRNAEIRQDIASLRQAIDRAAYRHTISGREATRLRDDARQIQRLYASYARNGLTRGEVATLEQRVNAVRGQLRLERRDWDGRRG